MLCVMALSGCAVDRAEFRSDQLQVAAFETRQDFAHKTPFDGVGLTDNERTVGHSDR